jgi:dTMP kinase
MGHFFVFEGIDGSGKTTLSKKVAETLQIPPNTKIIWHREPTDGVYGKQIRNFLAGRIELGAAEQMELFLKDRAESVSMVIKPNLEINNIIIQDRYIYSTAAYQGGKYLSAEQILETNHNQGFPLPDQVFFLDITPEEASERRVSRGGKKEYFDDDSTQNLIYQNYMKILPANTIFLDATQSLEDLTAAVLSNITLT